jgi:hypothetical protein
VTCHSVNLAFDRGGKGVCARHIHLDGTTGHDHTKVRDL